jgi:hypothetical protein
MDKHTHHMATSESSPVEYAKFAAVITVIIVVSLLLQKIFGSIGLQGWMRWFMGVFFIVFASFKFIGYHMFAVMFAGYDVVAKHFKAYAYAYPFVELILGLAYLTNQLSPLRDWATLIVMGIGTIGVAQEIKKRSGIHCACLGNVIKLPLSTVSLVEDVGMGVMALIILLFL